MQSLVSSGRSRERRRKRYRTAERESTALPPSGVPCPLTPSSYLVRDPHPLPPTQLPRPSGPRATPPRAPPLRQPRARTRLERRASSRSVSLSATCEPVVSQCLRNNIIIILTCLAGVLFISNRAPPPFFRFLSIDSSLNFSIPLSLNDQNETESISCRASNHHYYKYV